MGCSFLQPFIKKLCAISGKEKLEIDWVQAFAAIAAVFSALIFPG